MPNLANDSFFEDKQTYCVNIQAHLLEAACSMSVRCPLQPVQKLYSIYPFPWCKILKQSWLKGLTLCMQFNFACFYHMAVRFKQNDFVVFHCQNKKYFIFEENNFHM